MAVLKPFFNKFLDYTTMVIAADGDLRPWGGQKRRPIRADVNWNR